MSFAHSPQIVTNGLVLALDAGNTKSYVSGSTTWFDKSGNGNNGTLTNGPTFSSANGGSIVFDGVDDYVNVGNIGNYTTISYTLESFVYPEFDSSLFGKNFMSKSTSCSSTEFTFEYGRQTNKFSFITRDDITLVSNSTYAKNNWYHVMLSRTNNGNGTYTNTLYVNGALDTSTTVNYNPTSGTGLFGIGSSIGCTNVGYWTGKIAISRVYNRVLSAAEVQQNFNAIRGRFGI